MRLWLRTLCKFIGAKRMDQIKMNTADWVFRWDEGDIGFHKSEPHPSLVKHFDRLVQGRNWILPKIYIPLCGKAVDLKWLADKDFSVTGVEAVEKAVRDFFAEQNLPFEEQNTTKESLKLFQRLDKRIKLYCGDFFDLDSSVIENKFDLVFDRGSFVAINIDERERYVNLMCSLINPDARWLLVTMDYNPETWSGPPHFVPPSDMEKYFGDPKQFHVEFLDEVDCLSERHKTEWGLEWLVERTYLISLKK